MKCRYADVCRNYDVSSCTCNKDGGGSYCGTWRRFNELLAKRKIKRKKERKEHMKEVINKVKKNKKLRKIHLFLVNITFSLSLIILPIFYFFIIYSMILNNGSIYLILLFNPLESVLFLLIFLLFVIYDVLIIVSFFKKNNIYNEKL